MYPCSNAFHAAVKNNAPQMALFVFGDGVLTNEDIDMEAGVEFKDYFCTTEDLGIGEALSNELNFSLFNAKQLLNDFPFGEFTALLGVRINHERMDEGLVMDYAGRRYSVSSARDHKLLADGTPTSGQPPFRTVCMAAKDDVVYCYDEYGELYAISASSGGRVTCPDNLFMRDKMARRSGFTFSYGNKILTIVDASGQYRDTYEFVPLGIFIAERPKVTDDVELALECNDRMTLLDEDMNLEIEYPITAKDLLRQVCASAGVPAPEASFLNEGATLAEKPQEFENCVKRDVVRWIAEIAGCNAKIDRSGRLSFVWIKTTTQGYDEGMYTECRPYHYQTEAVSKLCSRDMTASEDVNVGSGDNIYLIQDNPFLK